jgi:hypothetical protein
MSVPRDVQRNGGDNSCMIAGKCLEAADPSIAKLCMDEKICCMDYRARTGHLPGSPYMHGPGQRNYSNDRPPESEGSSVASYRT